MMKDGAKDGDEMRKLKSIETWENVKYALRTKAKIKIGWN